MTCATLKLLTIAHEANGTYGDISKCTVGVMFMGTPHLGSDLANWSRIFRGIGNICTLGSIRTDLLKGLETKSAELAELSAQFVHRAEGLKIVSVYEGRPIASALPIVRNIVSYDIIPTSFKLKINMA